jgi:hypothetical protein
MKTLTLKAADAVAIASLIACTATGRDSAPVLRNVSVTVDGGNVLAIATDRFAVARYGATGDGEPGSLRITPAVAKWIMTNVKKGRGYGNPDPVEFTYSEETGELSARHGLAVIGDTWTPAKFPDVDSLFTAWAAADTVTPVTLRAEFLARLGKFVNDFQKVNYWLIDLGATPGRPDRPGPVRARAAAFDVLIQPNLLRPNG